MDSIDKLIKTVARLRAPDGCPWDREQTHKSIRGHLVEECAELLETIDLEDYPHMREELGDLLMHIVLHSRIAEESGNFTFEEVAAELNEKLIRRHPHVFGAASAEDSAAVVKIWTDVKAKEKADKKTIVSKNFFENIPPALSALRLAREAAKKLPPEVRSQADCALNADASATAGKAVFDAVKLCVEAGQEPESALRDYLTLLRKTYENHLGGQS